MANKKATTTKLPTSDRDSQARAFVHSMKDAGWMGVTEWCDGKHLFELFVRANKRLIVQTYPDGHGFEVWRPLTDSNSIADTEKAVEAYGKGEL